MTALGAWIDPEQLDRVPVRLIRHDESLFVTDIPAEGGSSSRPWTIMIRRQNV